jgi:HK97 gp10 family phage protein
VIDRAPEKTGKLKKNVVVVTQKSRRRGEISSGVHIRGVNPRTGNSDNTMKASNKRNAFYWRFVELGTSTAPAHPFVRPAFDTRMEEAAQVAMQRMNKAIDEVLEMTEDDLYDLLSPLADGRVYPYVVPLGSDDLPDGRSLHHFLDTD